MTDGRRYKIGYALAPKKQQSFIQPSLVELAKKRGIDLISIDSDKPLIDQGPFDCVLHKLPGEDWKKQLEEYESNYPHVYIIDRPEAIERLHNRISMLQVVSELRIPEESETFGTPKQVVIYRSEALGDLQTLGELKFPVIAKPLVADGSAKSHKMSLVFNSEGLLKLKPPLVLQEFVNHGGVIFKVYVVGDYVKCVKRKSLPDVPEEKLGSSEGSLTFCQISNMTRNRNEYYEVMHLEDAEFPPSRFVDKIAKGLRRALGLNLFNFDVIRDTKAGNRYLVIDINYFPGYAKMPAYEPVLTDFFCNIFRGSRTLQDNAAEGANSYCMFSDRPTEEEVIVYNSTDAGVSPMIVEEKMLCHNGNAMEEGFVEKKADGIVFTPRASDEGFAYDSTDSGMSTSTRTEAFPL